MISVLEQSVKSEVQLIVNGTQKGNHSQGNRRRPVLEKICGEAVQKLYRSFYRKCFGIICLQDLKFT